MSWHRGNPDAVAIVSGADMITYAELDEQIAERIETFRHVGIGSGQRIALLQHNSVDYIVSLLALIERGAVICPMNARWPESTVYEAMTRIGAVFLQDMLERGHSTQSIEASLILTDARWATVVFTSGSSGTPKAAVHSLANLRASAQASNQNIALASGDRWLLSLPLYHVGGLGVLFRCLESGATVVVPDANEALAASIERYAPTHLSLVSTQLYRLLQDADATRALSKMKAVLMGGSAMPARLIAKASEQGIALHTSYGMTEMSTQITCTPAGASLEELSTSGRELLSGSIRINDAGEIEVSGACLFQGYLMEEGVDLPLTVDGFFKTGDTGQFDDDGYLEVTGRMDRQFVSGGENIQPAAIERALCQLDGVLQAVVIGVDDDEFGQRPVAFVRQGGDIDETHLKEQLRSTLPGYMIPERILPWPDDVDEGMKINLQDWYQYLD